MVADRRATAGKRGAKGKRDKGAGSMPEGH